MIMSRFGSERTTSAAAALSAVSLLATALMLALPACAPAPPPAPELPPAAAPARSQELHEKPAPDGPWRPHRLSTCQEDADVPPAVERYLGLCSEYYRDGSGSDGMIELELGLEAGHRHGLILVALGQLYLMAGQGEPSLLPVEGPAADVGDWNRNRSRLLARAGELLTEAAGKRPDDAAVDYLLADVARARGDFDAAAEIMAEAADKCTGGRTFALMQLYQQLNRYPARYLGGASPVYPAAEAERGVQGDVVLDVLLGPNAQIRQIVTVSSPSAALAEAASASLRLGAFEASRLGKYPIWSWLRVTTSFNLEG